MDYQQRARKAQYLVCMLQQHLWRFAVQNVEQHYRIEASRRQAETVLHDVALLAHDVVEMTLPHPETGPFDHDGVDVERIHRTAYALGYRNGESAVPATKLGHIAKLVADFQSFKN